MGQTIADRNKDFYRQMLSEGYSYEEIIKAVPKERRDGFIEDISMSDFNAHFGMELSTFIITMVLAGIAIVVTVYLTK